MQLRSGYCLQINTITLSADLEEPGRKRHCSNNSSKTSLPPKLLPLTKQNLRAFEKTSMAKSPPRPRPKLRNNPIQNPVSGKCKPLKSVPESTTEPSNTTGSETISTTDISFGVALKGKGIRFGCDTEPPKDSCHQQAMLNMERASQGPSRKEYHTYNKRVAIAPTELQIQTITFHMLYKDPIYSGIQGYHPCNNVSWIAVKNDITDGLAPAKPDYYECFDLSQYPIRIQEALGQSLQPSRQEHTMPRLCIEFKRPDGGNMTNAEQQSAYYGAIMVNAAWEQHKFQQLPAEDFLNITQALTVKCNGRYLSIYANYATAAGEAKAITYQSGIAYPNKLHYHQYMLECVDLEMESHFRQAYKYVRNAQDWSRNRAVESKDALLEAAGRILAVGSVSNKGIDDATTTNSKRRVSHSDSPETEIKRTQKKKRRLNNTNPAKVNCAIAKKGGTNALPKAAQTEARNFTTCVVM
jgi:hypothetical protein